MKRLFPTSILLLVSAALVLWGSVAGGGAVASASVAADDARLSPYWGPRIRQWTSLILQEAERRDLDPDFLASLVWMESRGDAQAIGPVGAAGLMQVMPKEAGFNWRPTTAELLDPETNLYWGARTLATVVRQGEGNIFSALAAYNGGWDQITYRGPKRFAATILRDYANAVAARHGGLTEWTAFFAVKEAEIRGPIWVSDSSRDDVYDYGLENVTSEGGPLIPAVAPTSVLASCHDSAPDVGCSVGVWIFDKQTQQWVAPHDRIPEPTPTAAPVLGRRTPSIVVMAGSSRPSGWGTQPASAPTPSPVPAMGEAVSDVAVTAPGHPAVSPPLAVVPTATPLPDPSLPYCPGGALRVDAWPLERDFTLGDENTPEGWKARIFVEGHGGDCVYTYAWNGPEDVRAANVRGPITFEVTSDRRDSVILGTVVVMSGGDVQRVGMYIHPPGE